MAVLLTHKTVVTLTPLEFAAFTSIQAELDDLVTPVELVFSAPGAVDLSASLGTVAAYVTGTSGGDIITTGAGNDRLLGGAGADILIGGLGIDTLTGGLGDDLYFVDNSADIVTEFIGQGNDRIIASVSFSLLTTGANVETLAAASGQDGMRLEGNLARNAIIAGSGNDTLLGGGGDDTLTAQFGRDMLYGGTGSDVLFGGPSSTTLDGGAGNDFLYGSGSNDSYFADQGDFISDSGGFDTVYTFAASYTLAVNGIERLAGLATTGMALTGNALTNTLAGNDGNDTLSDGGGGADSLRGGGGNDRYLVTNTSVVISEYAGRGTDTVQLNLQQYEIFTLAKNIENLTNIGNAVTLIGNDGANVLRAGQWSDEMDGGGGNDLLLGGAGADSLSGGTGADTMFGYSGNDSYFVDNTGDQVIEYQQGHDEVLTSLTLLTLAANVEDLDYVGTGNATLTGNSADNVILGDIGNDRIAGGTGNDTLFGDLGNDTLLGDAGDDFFLGFGGNDVFTGGIGRDEFRFELALLPENATTITDFAVGQDIITFDNQAGGAFTGLADGLVLASRFKLAGQALDADDRLIYNAATGALFYDADGSGSAAAILFTTLTNRAALSASDFGVI